MECVHIGVGLLCMGCATASAPSPARAPDTRSLDAALSNYVAESAQPTSRQVASRQPAQPASRQVASRQPAQPASRPPAQPAERPPPLLIAPRTIRESPRRVPRPFSSGRRIDVHFADAELGQALALLANAGHFNLVTRDLPAGRVTLALRDVNPYQALVAICEARGVAVHTRGRIVIVTAAR